MQERGPGDRDNSQPEFRSPAEEQRIFERNLRPVRPIIFNESVKREQDVLSVGEFDQHYDPQKSQPLEKKYKLLK